MHAEVIDKLNLLITKISKLNFVNFKKTLQVLAYPQKHPSRDFINDLQSDPGQFEIVNKILKKFKKLDKTNPEGYRDCISEIQIILEKITKYHVKNAGDLQISLQKIFPLECKFPKHPATTSALQAPRQFETTKKRRPIQDESESNEDDQKEAQSESVSSRKAKKTKDAQEEFEIDSELDDLIHAACEKVPLDKDKSEDQVKALKKDANGQPTNELNLIILISPPDRYKDDKARSEFGEKLYNYLIWRCGLTGRSTKNIAFKRYPLPADFHKNTNLDQQGRKSFPDNCLFGSVRVRARTIITVKNKIAEVIAERSNQKKVTHVARSNEAPKNASPPSQDSQTEQSSSPLRVPPRIQPATVATSAPKPLPPSSAQRERDNSGKFVSPLSTPPYKSSFNVRRPGPFVNASSPLFKKPASSRSAVPSIDQSPSLNPHAHLNIGPTSLPPLPESPLPEFRESEPPSDHLAKPAAAAQGLLDLALQHSSSSAALLSAKEVTTNKDSHDSAAPAVAQAPIQNSPELKKSQESAESAKTPVPNLKQDEIIKILDDPDIISLLDEDKDLKQEREQADKLFAEQLKAAEAAAKLLLQEQQAREKAESDLKAAAREIQRKVIADKNAEREKLRLETEQKLKDAEAQKALTAMANRKRALLFSPSSANTSVAQSPNPSAAPPSTPMQTTTTPAQVPTSDVQTPTTPSSPPRQ